MTTLTITRAQDSAGLFRRMQIHVDDVIVARLRPKQSVTVDVGSGPHVVQARMDWCASPTVVVDSDALIDVEYPFGSVTKLFRDPGHSIKISVRT
jgi:hypothetical protein